MNRHPLVAANRCLIEAVETPPESGLKPRIDDLAAAIWALERRATADPGACCRLREKLRSLERRCAGHRRPYVARARRTVERYAERCDSI